MALTNFAGAVAVITGGASGIGLATARALRAKGTHLILADINSQGLQQAEQDIRQQSPGVNARVLGVPTDVTNEAQVQALMHKAVETCGRIDLVMTSQFHGYLLLRAGGASHNAATTVGSFRLS